MCDVNDNTTSMYEVNDNTTSMYEVNDNDDATTSVRPRQMNQGRMQWTSNFEAYLRISDESYDMAPTCVLNITSSSTLQKNAISTLYSLHSFSRLSLIPKRNSFI